jgi:hypothetical protein
MTRALHSGLLSITVLAAGLLGTTAAIADRPATPDEAARIVSGYDPDADVACFATRVSTADATWALLSTARDAPSTCGGGDGFLVLHDAGVPGWEVVAETGGIEPCPFKGVPDAVAKDLRICEPPSRKVFVARGSSLVFKPKMLIQGAHGAYVKLRWSHWGASTAVGRGTLDYSDPSVPRYRVRITLSRIALCGAQRTYQDMKVTWADRPKGARKRFFEGKVHAGCGYDA